MGWAEAAQGEVLYLVELADDGRISYCAPRSASFHNLVLFPSTFVGDILTDLAAMVQGGLGIAASGNLHPGRVSLFEPIHGSAPKYAGRNVASPVATIMAVQMMLEYLGETRAAQRIEDAVAELIRTRKIPSLGSDSGLSTVAVGDLVLEALGEAATVAGSTQGAGQRPSGSLPGDKKRSTQR